MVVFFLILQLRNITTKKYYNLEILQFRNITT
jgi:hypothetical protein